MSSRIEQIIEEIEEYIDSCKFQPLSTTKIIVNKDQMDELLRELRMKTPDEIKRYQKIIANKDAILADAQAKADGMIQEAQIQTNELVSEHEIMQRINQTAAFCPLCDMEQWIVHSPEAWMQSGQDNKASNDMRARLNMYFQQKARED